VLGVEPRPVERSRARVDDPACDARLAGRPVLRVRRAAGWAELPTSQDAQGDAARRRLRYARVFVRLPQIRIEHHVAERFRE